MERGLLEKVAWTEFDRDHDQIETLATDLARVDAGAADAEEWPETLWRMLDSAGVPRWQVPTEFGGMACDRSVSIQRYAQLAQGSLTAVFILSQHDAAIRRLIAGAATAAHNCWLSAIGAGRAFATVGISHLTTSRRLGSHAIVVTELGGGKYRLDGNMPWVTAAPRADLFVTGAALDDGRQLLIALPADRRGVRVNRPFALAALQASCTSQVDLENVEVGELDLLAGPALELFSQSGAVGTAGLETSALALGQARAALVQLIELASHQNELAEPLEALCDQWSSQWIALIALSKGQATDVSSDQLRAQANALVLNATQAYLTARKGTGFLRTEPAQRWARQALFFLVWSCPAPVAQAAIRDLAGLCQV